jgi:DNA-binding response OmpR family regulator
MATLAVDSGEGLPSSTEWLVQATNAVIQIDRRSDGLHQVRVNRALMGSVGEDDPITLQLTPGKGLVPAGPQPARRRADRPSGAAERILLLSLDKSQGGELESWAGGAFQTEIVREPLEAVTMLQEDAGFGGILVHATRQEIRSAVRACRAIRPLTGAAVVVASDDALRSTDRVALLDSGADDCLSGGVDFRELEARLRQAVSVGGKPPSEMARRQGTKEATGGMVSIAEFRSEVEKRAGTPAAAIFSVVHLTSGMMDVQALEQALTDTVRAPEGDLVARIQERCLVLLQGARMNAAHAFLARFEQILRERLGAEPKLKASVLASPVSVEGFENMLTSGDGIPGGADDAQA